MKTYRFEVVIQEGNDEFWEELISSNTSGCDTIRENVQTALDNAGIEATVKLLEYKEI